MLRMKMGLVKAAGCGAGRSEVLTTRCQDDAITSPTITDELLPSVLQTAGTLHSHGRNYSMKKENLSDISKGLICEKLACADLALVDGSSEALQLLDVASYIMRRLRRSGEGSYVDALVASH